MMATLASRLASIDGRSTCRLTHYGRKSGKPYEVTIWFMVEGDIIYLATAKASRQWVRNVQANPRVIVRAGGEALAGVVEHLRDRADERHVMDLVVAKYWYVRPVIALARLAGFDPTADASFRVRLEDDVFPKSTAAQD
jgi:deazaflavin-dependent oxidoreductase (nitroreductase family)